MLILTLLQHTTAYITELTTISMMTRVKMDIYFFVPFEYKFHFCVYKKKIVASLNNSTNEWKIQKFRFIDQFRGKK